MKIYLLVLLLFSYININHLHAFQASSDKKKNITMNKLIVKQIPFEDDFIENLSPKLDSEGIEFHPISNVNWSSFPYQPLVKFRIAHDNAHIFLNFVVREKSVRAKYEQDNDRVWTDSCVEFFFTPPNSMNYYNLECNCIGTILLGGGDKRKDRTRANVEITSKIKRWSSLGQVPFDERLGSVEWEIALIIPTDVFFLDQIDKFSGCTAKANFYKCGDELCTPHYLSWNPIDSDKPNFHQPQFFGELFFE